MPVRIDCQDRISNLRTVLSWIDLMNYPILLLEADKEPHCSEFQTKYANVTYHYIEDHDTVFHRTKYINQLINMASTPVVAVWDADIIVPIEQIQQASRLIVENGCTIAYPYDGRYIMLSSEMSDGFRREMNLQPITEQELKPIYKMPFCGGIFLISKKQYLEIGGENEKFVGWGPEDAERLRRCQITGHKAQWIKEGRAYHLFHKRNIEEQEIDNENLILMRKEFVKICSMEKDELLDYIRASSTFK